ncbi:uncharacterized protein [Haliotis asinina]|uniref:uncharacterized protein n=1 Tax=Haliotis asinina TaxID=109174 RepID=UPI003531E3E1
MGLDKHGALWYWLVMSLYIHGLTEQQEIIFDADQKLTSFSPPSHGTNRTVTAGRNITFVCRITASQGTVHVEWYRTQRGKTAEVQYYSGRCGLRNHTLPRLSVKQKDCEGGQFKLRIQEVDTSFEADWFCVVIRSEGRFQSQYIGFHVSHDADGTGQDIQDVDTPRLISGVAGGGVMLLVITMCVLLRRRRTRNADDSGRTSVQTVKDQGSDESVVMEDNPMYCSCDEEYGVHTPKSGQECDVYTEIQKQPKTVAEFCGQDGMDDGNTYAKPDKRRNAAIDEQPLAGQLVPRNCSFN